MAIASISVEQWDARMRDRLARRDALSLSAWLREVLMAFAAAEVDAATPGDQWLIFEILGEGEVAFSRYFAFDDEDLLNAVLTLQVTPAPAPHDALWGGIAGTGSVIGDPDRIDRVGTGEWIDTAVAALTSDLVSRSVERAVFES